MYKIKTNWETAVQDMRACAHVRAGIRWKECVSVCGFNHAYILNVRDFSYLLFPTSNFGVCIL